MRLQPRGPLLLVSVDWEYALVPCVRINPYETNIHTPSPLAITTRTSSLPPQSHESVLAACQQAATRFVSSAIFDRGLIEGRNTSIHRYICLWAEVNLPGATDGTKLIPTPDKGHK